MKYAYNAATLVCQSLFRTLIHSALCALLTLTVAASVSAQIIVEDDFNRSNSSQVGALFLETELDGTDVAIYRNNLRMRDQSGADQDAAVVVNYDLSPFESFSLEFDWGANSGTEASDTLFAGWYQDSIGYTEFWSSPLGGSSLTNTQLQALPGPSNDSPFFLAFWIDVSAASETAYIDNLRLTGDLVVSDPNQHSPVAVPEPSPLILLTLGLIALLFSRRVS